MTWSLTPAELSVAGTTSKPHHYKHNLQKTKDLPKTWVLRGKQFEDFRQKKNTSVPDQTTPWNKRTLSTIIEYGFCKQQELN